MKYHAMLIALGAAALVAAADAKTLVIGQVAELSGVAVAAENTAGAKLWLDHASRGGQHTFVLKAYDDQRDPKKTVAFTHQLVEQDHAAALFGYRSTPSLEAILPLLNGLQVPVVAPFNGSDAVRKSGGDWMFFLRATYADEITKMVDQARLTGLRRFAVLHQRDPFGEENAKSYVAALSRAGLAPMATFSYDRKSLDTSEAVRGLLTTAPEAVLMACTPKACGDVIRQVRAAGNRMMFFVLSNAVSDEFLSAIRSDGTGVVMAQVVPFPWDTRVPIVKEFNALNAKSRAGVPVSHASLEGFAAAKLLTIAAGRAGPQADAHRIAEVLRTTGPIDLGGIVYDPKGQKHLVDLTMLSRNGRLIR